VGSISHFFGPGKRGEEGSVERGNIIGLVSPKGKGKKKTWGGSLFHDRGGKRRKSNGLRTRQATAIDTGGKSSARGLLKTNSDEFNTPEWRIVSSS